MNGPTKVTSVVYDTCAATFLIKDDKRMLDIAPDYAEARKFASIITRMELRAEPRITAEKLRKVEDFIADTAIIPLDGAVEKLAVAIRRDSEPKVKLPDCIVAASAVLLGATLLTDDTSLKGLVWPGYVVRPV
jgi:predicted nucleic acid-binding protein